jgi:hypothetical protein
VMAGIIQCHRPGLPGAVSVATCWIRGRLALNPFRLLDLDRDDG